MISLFFDQSRMSWLIDREFVSQQQIHELSCGTGVKGKYVCKHQAPSRKKALSPIESETYATGNSINGREDTVHENTPNTTEGSWHNLYPASFRCSDDH
jgi:hypothetical protein